MKGKILLMAILSASVLSGCFHVPEYKAGENVVFKNSTEREIDYIYDTNSTFSDQYQFKAQGKEIDYAADVIIKAVNRLRNLSPLWEMKQKGIDINKINWAKH